MDVPCEGTFSAWAGVVSVRRAQQLHHSNVLGNKMTFALVQLHSAFTRKASHTYKQRIGHILILFLDEIVWAREICSKFPVACPLVHVQLKHVRSDG